MRGGSRGAKIGTPGTSFAFHHFCQHRDDLTCVLDDATPVVGNSIFGLDDVPPTFCNLTRALDGPALFVGNFPVARDGSPPFSSDFSPSIADFWPSRSDLWKTIDNFSKTSDDIKKAVGYPTGAIERLRSKIDYILKTVGYLTLILDRNIVNIRNYIHSIGKKMFTIGKCILELDAVSLLRGLSRPSWRGAQEPPSEEGLAT